MEAVGRAFGRDAVSVTGDGAAGFHFFEMQSAAREGLAVETVVLAEGSGTMGEPNERLRSGRTFGTATGEVRWDRVAGDLLLRFTEVYQGPIDRLVAGPSA
jgi:acetolactate synthase-1/2/3 large subunit